MLQSASMMLLDCVRLCVAGKNAANLDVFAGNERRIVFGFWQKLVFSIINPCYNKSDLLQHIYSLGQTGFMLSNK